MSILLYCVAPEPVGETNVPGVGGASVRSEVHGGLRYFLSETRDGADDLAKAAREVLGVIQDVFSRGPVLPFRYPTVLKEEAELVKLAGESGTAFANFLERIGSRVQMDVRLMHKAGQLVPQTTNSGNLPPAVTSSSNAGREYLAERVRWKTLLHAASEGCRKLAGADDWRVEDRGDQVLCHALISKHEVISYQERMRGLVLPDGVEAVVSGPWPPAGFWEDKSL